MGLGVGVGANVGSGVGGEAAMVGICSAGFCWSPQQPVARTTSGKAMSANIARGHVDIFGYSCESKSLLAELATVANAVVEFYFPGRQLHDNDGPALTSIDVHR